MPLTIADLCDGTTLEIVVEIALVSAQSGYAIWDVDVWDSGLWGPDEVWTDVSAYVLSVDTSRALSRDMKTWSSGSITVSLNNVDGRFSPDNLAGPYAPGGISSIIPGRGIRYSIIHNSVTYRIFTGYIDELAESFESYGPRTGSATMTITGSDMWKRLANLPSIASGSVGSGDYFGQRITRILNAASYSGSTDLDTGVAPLQPTTFGSKPIEEIETVAASEGGIVFIGSDGALVGRDRYALVTDARSVTEQVVFGDGGGVEVPWSKFDLSPLTADYVINGAAYTAVGGVQQVYQDQTSISLYGPRWDQSSQADKLVCLNDADVLLLAKWAVITGKLPEARVDGLTVDPLLLPASMLPVAVDLSILDLVKIIIRPPSATSHTITRWCYVSGISTTVAAGNLQIGYQLSSASTLHQYAQSRWDVGLWGASATDPDAARYFI